MPAGFLAAMDGRQPARDRQDEGEQPAAAAVPIDTVSRPDDYPHMCGIVCMQGRTPLRSAALTIAVAVLLAGCVLAILSFAHSYAILDAGKLRCPLKWPDWIGCTMAAHENLAG